MNEIPSVIENYSHEVGGNGTGDYVHGVVSTLAAARKILSHRQCADANSQQQIITVAT